MIVFSQQNMLYCDRISSKSAIGLATGMEALDRAAVFAPPPLLAMALPWRAADDSGFFAIGAGLSAGAFCLGAVFALNALFIDAFKSASYEGGLSSEFKTVSRLPA